jgi:hypothetical protein
MANPFVTFFNWVVATWKAADTLGKINMILTAATLAVGVKGFMQARQMLAKGQDILANKVAAGGKMPVVYGTRRVGAQIVYMDVSNNDSRHLFVVYALSVGECDEILYRTIELDGNPLTDPNRFKYGCYVGSDRNNQTGYNGHQPLNTVSQVGSTASAGAGQFGTNQNVRYRITLNLHHGTASQTADPMLVASMPNWTSSHKLNGVCYIAAHYKYDKEGMFAGVPQLTVQVKGKRIYDPRDTNQQFGTPTTYKHSDNPALVFLDYITNNEYGKGLTASQINMTTFSSAANVCDTQVDQPYFNGTAQSLTWSANSGDNFFTIAGADANEDWWQNKIGEILDLFDSNGNGVIDGDEIIDIQRSQFFDSTAEYIVFINSYFGSNYASQTGSSLLKVKRFTTNGYLDANKNVMENAKELLANMRGIFLYINGQYELSIEDTGTSSFSINDNHIIADAGISVDYGNKDKKANKVIVEFFNANKKYELDTATVLHDATPEYYSDDGDEILEIKAEFPYITDPYIAYNMGKAILTRSRNQTTMQFLGTPEMYKLNVGDIVDLTYAGLGFSGKVCRVEALELQSNGLVAVSLIEYFDVYTWEVPPQEPVEELANLPSAYAVKPPTNISFTDSDSSPTGRPFLSWDEPTDFPDYQYRVNVVDSSGNQLMNRMVDVESCDLTFIPTGLFVANITSLNTLGVESSPARFPTTGNFTVGTPPTGSGDIQDGAVDLDALAAEVQSAINAGGVDSTQLIKSTSAPTTRNDGSALQAQDLWADTDDDNQIYVRNSSNNGWEKARDSSLVTLYNSLSSTVTTNSSNIATAQSDIVTLTTDTSANASAITSLTSTVNSNTSAITTEQTTRANADSALAADITSLTSTVNGNTASITTNATAITDINGNASASYVLQLNANGKVAQMVLESNADAGTGATSTIAFLADTFKIDNDAGSSVSPFVVSGGSVLIDNARINNLSADKILIDGVTLDTDGSGNLIIKSGGVDTGQIKDNAIINDKIAANQITADKIITTDLFLPTNGGEKTGTTLGYWNENDLNYRHVAEIGSGAGFYTGYVRVYKGSFAGQVKGISFLVSDGTYGSGSSYDVNTVVSFYDVTKITESASHAIYVSTDLEYLTGGWITASRLTTAKDSGNIPIAFRYTGTGTLNFFIYAEGDSNTQYIGGCDVRLVKFST